jgi:hypothetical protein
MRFRLRTLLIVLAIGPPLLAGAWFAALWLTDDRNKEAALHVFMLAMLYLAAVTIAVYSKRIARWAFGTAGRWIKG